MNNMLLFLIIHMVTLISLNANTKLYLIETFDNHNQKRRAGKLSIETFDYHNQKRRAGKLSTGKLKKMDEGQDFQYIQGKFELLEDGNVCKDPLLPIITEEECITAAKSLNLKYGGAFNGPQDFPDCLLARDGRNLVYFNLSPEESKDAVNEHYAGICKTTATFSDSPIITTIPKPQITICNDFDTPPSNGCKCAVTATNTCQAPNVCIARKCTTATFSTTTTTPIINTVPEPQITICNDFDTPPSNGCKCAATATNTCQAPNVCIALKCRETQGTPVLY